MSTRVHHSTLHRETEWPFQWIGQCSCGKGIRCNDERTATDFLLSEGCIDLDGVKS